MDLSQEIEETIAAHREDDEGWCAGEHEVPELYPCQTLLWMERCAELQRRQ